MRHYRIEWRAREQVWEQAEDRNSAIKIISAATDS
jgi:hypothetical protein